MLRFLFLVSFFVLPLHAQTEDKVCLIIDQVDTGHHKYPNQATEVEDYRKSFNVYQNQEACFDLDKSYYMQYFLWETYDTIVYGTKCLYVPTAEDEGKILRYEGISGATPCPVVDKFRIGFFQN